MNPWVSNIFLDVCIYLLPLYGNPKYSTPMLPSTLAVPKATSWLGILKSESSSSLTFTLNAFVFEA